MLGVAVVALLCFTPNAPRTVSAFRSRSPLTSQVKANQLPPFKELESDPYKYVAGAAVAIVAREFLSVFTNTTEAWLLKRGIATSKLGANNYQLNASINLLRAETNASINLLRVETNASINLLRAESNLLNASMDRRHTELINVLTHVIAATKVLCRRALEQDCDNKAKLAARSSTPTANGSGTVLRIALDGIDEGIELAGTEHALAASRGARCKLDSAYIWVGHKRSMASLHTWNVMDCVAPLLSHVQQPQQLQVSQFDAVPGKATEWDLTFPDCPPPPTPKTRTYGSLLSLLRKCALRQRSRSSKARSIDS
jgi:hypothetical protein